MHVINICLQETCLTMLQWRARNEIRTYRITYTNCLWHYLCSKTPMYIYFVSTHIAFIDAEFYFVLFEKIFLSYCISFSILFWCDHFAISADMLPHELSQSVFRYQYLKLGIFKTRCQYFCCIGTKISPL